MMIRHIVMVKFRADVSEDQIAQVQEGLGSLPDLIPEIESYEFGRDMARTDRSHDFALVSAFADMEALQTYMMNPDHRKVSGLIREIAEDIRVVDYEVEYQF
ncbi:MAG: Dabb family protein [Desulfobacterales bacterium]